MTLYKEILRHAGSTTIKETFFNKEKKHIAILETYTYVSEGSNGGVLSVYNYTGESYRLFRYDQETDTYKRFMKEGHAVLLTPGWHTEREAHYIRDCKYEKGLLMEEHTHHVRYDEKASITYTYDKGVKSSEIRTMADGTKITINYVNDSNGLLLSKSTLTNDVFTEQINYTYSGNRNVELEQTFRMHNGQKFLAAEKKYFYNPKNKLEKTEYYCRYDGHLYLYKVEEEILKDDVVSKKSSTIPEIDIAIGYYDLAALHSYFKENNMEGYISYFGKDFAAKGRLMLSAYTIETLDKHGNPVETKVMHPEKPEEQLTMVTYRNEYNEASLLEFVITYILNDNGKLEENSIRKLYYKEG